ncbi:hypothetical protein [Roseovarius aestuarii]|uniref:Uncharacterized protein n=1 Tax=Roseovarius aestuarii TaxID=475083 RepID=A0A1X7BRK0_9RHOB|nr:hypothetical protein [Roseovarius aestuarii]SMC12213.1 hypothetical protein ROA7745_02036 [Roseovarius aestuarii]
MATAAPPNPPTKDENKPANASVQSHPGTRTPKPTPMVFTDFASI